jgi:hypothetical protein
MKMLYSQAATASSSPQNAINHPPIPTPFSNPITPPKSSVKSGSVADQRISASRSSFEPYTILIQPQSSTKVTTLPIVESPIVPTKSEEFQLVKRRDGREASKSSPLVSEMGPSGSISHIEGSLRKAWEKDEENVVSKREFSAIWREKLEWKWEKKKLSSEVERLQKDKERMKKEIERVSGLMIEKDEVSFVSKFTWMLIDADRNRPSSRWRKISLK